MADSLTGRSLASRFYVPEESDDPEVQAALADPYQRVKALEAPFLVYGGAPGSALPSASRVATEAASAARATPGAIERAIQYVRGLDRSAAPFMQNVRLPSGAVQMRNLSAGAAPVVRLADGAIIKLAPGEIVPTGATVLNRAETPVGKMIAGTAVAGGVPAALAYETSGGQTAPAFEGTVAAPAVAAPAAAAPAFEGTVAAPAAAAPAAAAPAPPGAGPAPSSFANYPLSGYDRAMATAPVVDAARSVLGGRPAAPDVPMPPRRPPELSPPQQLSRATQQRSPLASGLAGIFSDPYAGKSAREMFIAAQQDPDNPSLMMRALAMKDDTSPPVAEKRGGSVGGGGANKGGVSKDDVIHKALEIIHHMMLRSR
jgi:hypothetical protein